MSGLSIFIATFLVSLLSLISIDIFLSKLLTIHFKESFLFVDPTNYISEESRSVTYSSLAFFKVLYLKEFLNTVSSGSVSLPFNTSLLNEYMLFYFFGILALVLAIVALVRGLFFFTNKKTSNLGMILIFNSLSLFLGYYVYRILYSMCVRSLI